MLAIIHFEGGNPTHLSQHFVNKKSTVNHQCHLVWHILVRIMTAAMLHSEFAKTEKNKVLGLS